MFEKEAEEYIKEHTFFDEEYGVQSLDVVSKTIFQDGAEFGYNKANEWHYPSKGEYPEENVECLCIDKIWTGQTFTTILQCCDGVFIDSNGTPYKVIAWKEIVLPELKGVNK